MPSFITRTKLAGTTSLCTLLLLTACGSEGLTRIGSIGAPPAGRSGANGGTGSTGTSGQDGGTQVADNGGIGATGGAGANGGVGATGGVGMNGTNGVNGITSGAAGPILVTAGNAAIGLATTHDGLAQNVNATLPVAAPVTGTVTAVLRDSGQTLVDVGNGQTLTLNKAAGAVGEVVQVDLGSHTVVKAPDGSSLIGVGVLSPTTPAGSIASVNVPNTATGLANGAAQTLAGVAETGGHVADTIAPGAIDGHALGSVATGTVGTATGPVGSVTGGTAGTALDGVVDTAGGTVASVANMPIVPPATGGSGSPATAIAGTVTEATNAVGTVANVVGDVSGAAALGGSAGVSPGAVSAAATGALDGAAAPAAVIANTVTAAAPGALDPAATGVSVPAVAVPVVPTPAVTVPSTIVAGGGAGAITVTSGTTSVGLGGAGGGVIRH